MRRLGVYIGMFLFLLFGLTITGGSACASTVHMWVNGTLINSDPPPQTINGQLMVPVLFMKDGLGMNVKWDAKARRVTIANAGRTVELVVNSQDAKVNGAAKRLDKAPVIIQGRTYLPFRSLGDLLGMVVGWEKDTQSIVINHPVTILGISKNSAGLSIKTDGPASFNAFKMNAPNRIVLDVQNALVMKTMQVAGIANNPAIKAVRFSQYAPGVVRIVIELNGQANYTTQASSDGILVKLKDIQLPAPPSTTVVKPLPVSLPASVPTQQLSQPADSNPVPAGSLLSNKSRVTIVLDAGHGGVDVGAIGVNKTLEKDFTISLVNKLAADLGQDPKFHVILTRHGDEFPSLTDRVTIANNAHADLFFSIHANSATLSANGTETYYYTDKSKQFAEIIHRYVVAATGFLDRKVKTAGFQVIKYTKMPALLEEVGFITNPENNREMMDEAFQQKVADSMYAGIKEYCSKN